MQRTKGPPAGHGGGGVHGGGGGGGGGGAAFGGGYATSVRNHTFTAVDSPDWKRITSAKQIFPPAYDPTEEDIMGDEPV